MSSEEWALTASQLGKRSCLVRWQRLVKRLLTAKRRLTYRDLAVELEVCEKTIVRDLEFLANFFGLDIDFPGQRRTGVLLVKRGDCPFCTQCLKPSLLPH